MDSFLTQAGYAAVILLAFLEACCVPIPSEITFGFGGVLAFEGHLNLALVIIAGTLAELAGSYVSYGVGRVAERPLIEKFGRYLLITKADIDRAERFLAGRGAWAIPLGRTLPFVRSFSSVVAGLTGVPAVRFGILSLIGTAVYGSVVASIGYAVGSAWHSVAHDLSLAGYVLAVVAVGAIAAFITLRLRQQRREVQETEAHQIRDRAPRA
ncbi:MAG TPA: DedA family protein [Streptosporangiaceae bacterium]|nr:DedA family protein [Streptosporangiaceae bacterium]